MNEKIQFLNMFSDYEPPESLHEAISQAAILAADLSMEERVISLSLECPVYLPGRVWEDVSREISSIYGLRKLEILPTYSPELLQCIEPEELRDLFISFNSMNRSSLAGAAWAWEDNTLTISLRGNGKKELEECIPAVQNLLRERFNAPVEILIHAGKALEGEALFEAMEQLRSAALSDRPVSQPAAASAPSKSGSAAPAAPSDVLYGKSFKGAVTPMSQLNLDMGSVIVEGRVFAVEHKELKKRNAWVINFDMTDNTGSVRINRFMEAGEAKPFLDNVKEGNVFRIQGKLMVNQFDNEMIL